MAFNLNFESFIDYLYEDRVYNYLSRRYIRDADNPMEVYSDEEFRKRYRFRKDTVMHTLVPMIFTSSNNNNNRGLPLPPILQVLIALRFYATGNFQIVCGDLHKLSQSVVSKTITKISKRLAIISRQYIKFPAVSARSDVKSAFYRIKGFPGVIGCIDCTHIPINNPSRDEGENFRNRKGWFSINIQIVCGPNMEIYDIVVRWPGSAHDFRIFANSRCCMRFEEGDLAGSGLLIGDSGYAQTAFMFTPVPNPQTDAENRYNRAHIATRNIIERLNGVLKRRFACLNRKLHNRLLNTCNIIVSCAVLHNVCILTNEPIQEYDIEVENEPEPNANETARGTLIRSAFIARHFS